MAYIDRHGFYDKAIQRPSAHCEQRPDVPISLIIIHNISLPPFAYGTDAIHRLFQGALHNESDPFLQSLSSLRVASHFMIDRKGVVHQYVSCLNKAYHAGISSFAGRDGCNDFSVGIELEGCDFEPYSEEQYTALPPLLRALMKAYPISAISGHQDVSPDRKTDPGHFFAWDLLRKHNFPVVHND